MIEEYEIQHYGFTIAELKQETADMIRDEVDKSCEILVQSIITNPEVDSKVAAEINRKKKILASELKDLFKESLDEMGNIMTDTFSIPANVTLSTDQLKLKSVDASEVELQEIFDEKMKRFKMIRQFVSTLNDELDTYHNMDSLFEIHNNATTMAEQSLMRRQDSNYIKELEANVKSKFNK